MNIVNRLGRRKKIISIFISLLIAIPLARTALVGAQTNEVELLSQSWHLERNNGASEAYQAIDPNVLQGKDTVRITYDLHGLNALGGDASALIFDQNGWQYVSLSNYGQNGLDGEQVAEIPLSDFMNLNPNESVGTLHTRFWYGSAFVVDITSIVAFDSQAASAPTPTPTPTPIPADSPSGGAELLNQTLHLTGNNGASEAYQEIGPSALQGMDTVQVTVDLNGLSPLGGDASALIFDQNGWQYVSLSSYLEGGVYGLQTVDIPLSDFMNLDPNQTVGTLHTRFWYNGQFTVDITSVLAYNSQASTAPTPNAHTDPRTPCKRTSWSESCCLLYINWNAVSCHSRAICKRLGLRGCKRRPNKN